MSKHFRHGGPSESSQEEVVGLLKKMQQQLTFLEKKIDTLLGQSHGQPAKQRHFFRPFLSKGHAPHPFREDWDKDSETQESSSGHPFEKRERREYREHRGHGPHKKPFFHKKRGHR